MHAQNNNYAAWLLLKITYALVPILLGIDKLWGWWIVHWPIYASPIVLSYLPLSVNAFIIILGIIEITAGILVWLFPRLGAYIVVLWMLLIVINLATMNKYYDIIARDLVIAIGALALAWLSSYSQTNARAKA